MDKKILKNYGLSDKEARVYLALLELGSDSVSNIAFKAKINRTTAYDILEYLVKDGLISYVGDKKTKHYAIENPELLVNYLDNKSREYKYKAREAKKDVLPELKALFNKNPKKPRVKYYEGEEGIISLYEDSLTSKTEILSWSDIAVTRYFAEDYFVRYYRRRAKRNVFIKAIVKDSQLARDYKKQDKELCREIRIVPEKEMAMVPECYIYDDKVFFVSIKDKFGVLIESQDIADAQRKLYNLAWERVGEYKE